MVQTYGDSPATQDVVVHKAQRNKGARKRQFPVKTAALVFDALVFDALVFDAVVHGASTAEEICQMSGVRRQTMYARLSDLMRVGAVRRVADRVAIPKGRPWARYEVVR